MLSRSEWGVTSAEECSCLCRELGAGAWVGGQAALCCWAQSREASEPQTTGVWQGFQVKYCFVLVLCTSTHSSYWLLWKLGSQGAWNMALTEFLKWCLWKREEILLFTVTGTLCSRWQIELWPLPSQPSVHLRSLGTVPELCLNPSFFLHKVNQTKLRVLLALSAFLSTDFKNFSGKTSLCVIFDKCLPSLSHFSSFSSLSTSFFSLLQQGCHSPMQKEICVTLGNPKF